MRFEVLFATFLFLACDEQPSQANEHVLPHDFSESQEESETENSTDPASSVLAPVPVIGSPVEPFASLKKVCAEAYGIFNEQTKECECRNANAVFSIYRREFSVRGACETINYETETSRFRRGVGRQTLRVESLVKKADKSGVSTRDPIVKDLHWYLDRASGVSPKISFSPLEAVGFSHDTVLYVGQGGDFPGNSNNVGYDSKSNLILSNLDIEPRDAGTWRTNEAYFGEMEFFEPEVKYLAYALGGQNLNPKSGYYSLEDIAAEFPVITDKTSFTDIPTSLVKTLIPHFALAGKAPSLAAYREQILKIQNGYAAYRFFGAKKTWVQTATRSVLGCADICDDIYIYQTNVPFLKLEERSHYVNGTKLFKYLVFRDSRNNNPLGFMVLSAGGGISSLHLLTYALSNDGSKLTSSISTLNRRFEVIAESGRASLFPIAKSSPSNQVRSRPTAIICESGALSNVQKAQQLLGPHTLQVSTDPVEGVKVYGSEHGWSENMEGSLRIAFGSQGFSHSTIGHPMESNDNHAAQVTQVFLESSQSENQFVKLSTSTCLDPDDSLVKNISAQAIKVASLQFSNNVDSQTCRSKMNSGLSRMGVLSVVAAGNSGENGTRAFLCPQNLSGSSDVLIVAGLDAEESLSRRSNYGKEFADVAASSAGPGNDFSIEATSFAAPRVSAIAADLSFEFDSLDAAELKKIIMISARLKSSPGLVWGVNYEALNVRSGGIADIDRSRAVAKAYLSIRDESGISLKSQFGLSKFQVERILNLSGVSKDEVKAKVSVLKNSGMIRS